MIVITGPGRSGTSLVAQAYARVGVNPGGEWHPEVRAGFEDPEVVRLNRSILDCLGVSTLGVRRQPPTLATIGVPARGRRLIKSVVPMATRERYRRSFERSPWGRAHRLKLIDWSQIDQVVRLHQVELQNIARDRALVKDPQFCWTLPIWIAAGAGPSHVVLTTRDVSSMLKSRGTADHLRFKDQSDSRNAMLYALGNALTAITDSGTPHTILRYPDFIDDWAALQRLPFPDGTDKSPLMRAFSELTAAYRAGSRGE